MADTLTNERLQLAADRLGGLEEIDRSTYPEFFDDAGILANAARQLLSRPTAPAEPVAFIERAVLDQLAKHKDATGTVASGLLKRPFGDPVPLYAAPPSPPYGRRQMARPDKTRVAIIAHVHPSKSNVATVVARALSAISDDRIASVYDIRIENPPDMPRFVAAPKEAEDDQT